MPSDPQSLLFRSDRAAPRQRVAVFLGEFSSGKSSLINCLIGRDTLRTRVTATQVPTVELRYGSPRQNVFLDYEGVLSPLGEQDPFSLHYDDCVLIRLHQRIPVLRKFALIDTPGISDPRLPMDVLKACADSADIAVWCTHATQAWRESERAAWLTMPERLRSESVLVVTRSDQLSAEDRTKLAQRLATETEGMFRAVIFASVPMITEQVRADDTSLTDWIVSGGAALFEALGVAPEDLVPEAEPFCDWLSLLTEEDPTVRHVQISAFADHFAVSCTGLIGRAFDRTEAIRLVEQYIWADGEVELALTGLGEDDMNTFTRLVSAVANVIVRRSGHNSDAENTDSVRQTGGKGGSDGPRNLAMNVPEVDESQELPRGDQADLSERSAEFLGQGASGRDKIIDLNQKVEASTSHMRSTLSEGEFMTTDISSLREIGGFIGACLVDSDSGLMIGSEGGGTLDLEMAAAGNTDFLRSKQKVMSDLGLHERIEDILITLGSQIHLIRPLENSPSVFLYLALDKQASNLGMARIKLRKIEATLEI